MITMVERTKENILQIASEYGIGEQSFIYLLKQKKMGGPFDPAKWDAYIEIVSRFPPCPICGGDQKCYQELTNRFRSPRGLGCRKQKQHFFIYHIGVPMTKREHPEMTQEQVIEWVRTNWKEVVLDAYGDSRYKEQCVEIKGKYYDRQSSVALSASAGSDNTII